MKSFRSRFLGNPRVVIGLAWLALVRGCAAAGWKRPVWAALTFAATLAELADRGLAGRVATPSITMRDFEKALLKARPTVSAKDIEVQEKFTSEFGEEGS